MIRLVRALRTHLAATTAGAALVLLGTIAAVTPAALGGYSATISNSRSAATTAPYFTCSAALAADTANAYFQWPLAETSGSAAADVSGARHPGTRMDASLQTDAAAPIACRRDGGVAWVLNGSSDFAYSNNSMNPPATFTEEIWFKTTVAGGRLIGYGTGQGGGRSTNSDRQLYIDAGGKLVFGVYPNTVRTISTAVAVNDGRWHHAAATLSSAGMVLYLDGQVAKTDTSTTTAESYLLGGVLTTGYWRVGYDDLSNWPNPPTSSFFKGSLRYAAVYTSALSATQILRHYAAGS